MSHQLEKKDPIEIAAGKTAAIKLNDKGVPACPVTSDEILKYRLKHGYNDFDPEKGVYYADFGARSRMSSKQSSVEAMGF